MPKPPTIQELQQIAKDRGGKCLSEAYTNALTKLLWECARGHQWQAHPSAVKHKTWCPYCARKVKRTIEEMHQIAKEHGGKCLSDIYKNTNTKLSWECSKGHQWETAPINVRLFGRWCPTCARATRRSTRYKIADMQYLAAERGGKCLSDTYKDAQTKLWWGCSQGHQWEAVPSSIKNGSWCPSCAGNTRHTIEEMQRIAEGRGGKCLSVNYKNNTTKLVWECSEGHRWEAMPMKVLSGNWCRQCHLAKQRKHPKSEQTE